MGKESLTERTIKNSAYNFAGTIISRIGGLVFTIILARMLLPELFGIYSLVFSIATILITFTDLGIGKTLIRYVSEALGKQEDSKATAYVRYLFRFRFYLTISVIFIIIILGKFIAVELFKKPEIYIPLLFASFYILMMVFFGFFKSVFTAFKNLKQITFMQLIFEVSRILLVILAIYLISESSLVSTTFIVLALALFFGSLYAFIKSDKKIFIKEKKYSIDKKRILSYIGFVSLVSISLRFFGSIDILMLGRTVSPEHIGFYKAAISLATSAGSLFAFAAVFLPVFTQIKGDRFERGFKKAFKSIVTFTIPSVFGIWILGKYFILAIYGKEYIVSSIPLYALALTIFIMPLVVLYSTLFEAREKPKILTKAILSSLGLNIILNFIFIKYFPIWFNKGPEFAILGAGIATITSRMVYLATLKKKLTILSGIRGEQIYLIKPLISSLVMAGFLILFNSFIDMNLYWGILGIILGVGIYFLVMVLLNGITKEDLDLLKKIVFRKTQENIV